MIIIFVRKFSQPARLHILRHEFKDDLLTRQLKDQLTLKVLRKDRQLRESGRFTWVIVLTCGLFLQQRPCIRHRFMATKVIPQTI